jgi:DNA-binding transcriptional ArsR family regulator
LAPIFRSALQGRLLALAFLRPEEEHTVADLARRLEVDHATVHREVHRLSAAGILQTRRAGRTRLVRAGNQAPFAAELAALVVKAFGPVPLLAELLAGLDGVEEAFVYGSWAERYLGGAGPIPGDIDVIVVGTPDRDRAYALAAEAGRITGLEVNILIRRPEAWRDADDGLLRGIREGTLVDLLGAAA